MTALGAADVFEGRFEQASKNLNEGKKLAQEIGADSVYLQAINMLAMSHYIRKDFPEAYRIYKEGIRKAQEAKNSYREFTFTMNLATTFSIVKDYDQALSYYDEALKLLENSNDKLRRAEIESNLGYLYWKTGDYDKAKYYANKAIPVFQEQEFGAWESFALTTLGGVSLEEKEIDKAIGFYNDALKILENLRDRKRETDVNLGLSQAYYKKSQLEQAKEFAFLSEEMAKSINYAEGILRSSQLLYEIFRDENNPEVAIKYLEIEQRLSDSIQIAENSTRLLMMEAENKFETTKELIQQENRREINQRNFVIYISLILLIALSLIAFLIRRNHLNQKNANKKLQRLNEIKDKIFTIIGHDLKSPIGTLQEFLSLYKDNGISQEEIAKITPRLKANVDHSAFTLNNLLTWATNQMNGTVTRPTAITVKDHTKQVVNLYSEKIEQKKLRVEYSIGSEIKVIVDRDHLDLILRNLILNAIKFTPKSGLLLFGGKIEGNKVIFSIKDSGIGMSPSQINSILKYSSVLPRSGTNNEKGTGIGLQITKELIELNGGNLKFESTPNMGTTANITFVKA